MRLWSVLLALGSVNCLHPKTIKSFGTEAPLQVVGYDNEGTWAVLCQSRVDTNGNGWADNFDDESMYLVVGGGEGKCVDSFFGAGPSGTWLAIAEDGVFQFRDVRSQTSIRATKTPRFVVFSPAGDRALFGALTGENSWLQLVDFGSGRVWQLPIDPSFDGNVRFTEDLGGLRLGQYIRSKAKGGRTEVGVRFFAPLSIGTDH